MILALLWLSSPLLQIFEKILTLYNKVLREWNEEDQVPQLISIKWYSILLTTEVIGSENFMFYLFSSIFSNISISHYFKLITLHKQALQRVFNYVKISKKFNVLSALWNKITYGCIKMRWTGWRRLTAIITAADIPNT